MLHRFKTSKRTAPQPIEVFVDEIEQLFNSMDPSPFPQKDLDDDGEEFILSWALEYPRRDPVALLVHVDQLPAHGDAREIVEAAVHNYFAYRVKLDRLEFRHLLKEGRASLIIGLVFLGACLLTSEFLLGQEPRSLSIVARESLTIAGWVAMWTPIGIFLYHWWPVRHLRRLYEKLSRMHVKVRRTQRIARTFREQ